MRKLYYEDSHLTAFSAKVTEVLENEKGFWVTLEETAFYPEGGGQPCDLGTLGIANVLDVQEREGVVWHLLDQPLSVGQQAEGKIDWERRFDLMQQHTAEHIISGIANRLYGCHNVGFHMGADVITLDFDKLLPEEALPKIEKLANEAVFANIPVQCSVPSEAELPTIPYRTKKALPWPVRLVEIPGYDTCACCGVHTKTTGELGLIKLLSCVKFHQGVRIEMVAGWRAYRMACAIFDQNRQVSQTFSAKVLETGEAARRMNAALTAEKFRSGSLERQLMDAIAQAFAGQEKAICFTKELPARPLAEQLAAKGAGLAAVFRGSDPEGYSFALISKTQDVAELGKALTRTFSGKGGGRDGFFQGSISATEEQIRGFW